MKRKFSAAAAAFAVFTSVSVGILPAASAALPVSPLVAKNCNGATLHVPAPDGSMKLSNGVDMAKVPEIGRRIGHTKFVRQVECSSEEWRTQPQDGSTANGSTSNWAGWIRTSTSIPSAAFGNWTVTAVSGSATDREVTWVGIGSDPLVQAGPAARSTVAARRHTKPGGKSIRTIQ